MFNFLRFTWKKQSLRSASVLRGIGKNGWRWIFYDWANSAFVLCVMTVLGSAWFIALFERAAEEAGGLRVGPALALQLFGIKWTAEAFWSMLVGVSAGVAAFSALFLGAAADAQGRHKQFALTFCLLGSVATASQVFSPWWGNSTWVVVALLIFIGNVGYESSNVFYNAYLPKLAADPQKSAQLSSVGYAMGYAGGALVLLLILAWFIPQHLPAAFLLVGLWWGGFGTASLGWLPTTTPSRTNVKGLLNHLKESFRHLQRNAHALRFLLAFLLYNDGVATLISNATPYALQNIYTDASLTQKVGIQHLIPMILIIQLMNIPGSLFLGWLTNRSSEKTTIFLSLVAFSITILLAQWIRTLTALYGLAVLIGLFLGGLQAISRSLFASFIPKGKEAEYFSFFAFSARFSAMLGPLVFGGLVLISGDTRPALLSLNVFFLAGGLLLAFVNPVKARSMR